MKSTRLGKTILLLALATFVLTAQSDLGSINGFVKDPTGATVPNATVTVKNEATGTERRVTSNESGYYTVTNIPAGFYTITVEAPGFKKFDTTHNKLDPNAVLAVDTSLTVGAATESVEVTATATPLQSESAAVQVSHAPADRFTRAEWPQPDFHGPAGPRRTRRHSGKLELQLQSGSRTTQRRSNTGELNHL